jgi:16S rRNA pseudouridine516 synthase
MPPVERAPRIDQLLSSLGYGSRADVGALVARGRVTSLSAPQSKLRPDMRVSARDLLVDGEPLDHPDGILLVMHKPVGVVCSHDEREGRSVYDLLPERWRRRNPRIESVGRLDKDTSGLLLLTDQHGLIHRLASPKHKVVKVYEAGVEGTLTREMIDLFASGTMTLRGESKPCQPAELAIIAPDKARLSITEGRYHQVRRMLAAVGAPVVTLHRSRFGELTLDGLAAGEVRSLPLDRLTAPG